MEGKLRAALDKVRALEGGGATRPSSRSIGAQTGEVDTSLRAEARDFAPAVQTVFASDQFSNLAVSLLNFMAAVPILVPCVMAVCWLHAWQI